MALCRRYLSCKYNILIALALIMTIIFILYKQDIRQTIYISIICIIIILLIQFMIVSILQTLFIDIKLSFTNGIIVQIIGFLGVILASKYIPFNYLYRYVLMDNKVFKYIILNIFVLLVSILLYWNIDMNGALKNIVTIATISLGIIYVNFILIKNGLKNEHIQLNIKHLP